MWGFPIWGIPRIVGPYIEDLLCMVLTIQGTMYTYLYIYMCDSIENSEPTKNNEPTNSAR